MPGTPTSPPPRTPRTSHSHLHGDRETADHLARRRVTVCVWEDGVPTKKALSVAELRATIIAKVRFFIKKINLHKCSRSLLSHHDPFSCYEPP